MKNKTTPTVCKDSASKNNGKGAKEGRGRTKSSRQKKTSNNHTSKKKNNGKNGCRPLLVDDQTRWKPASACDPPAPEAQPDSLHETRLLLGFLNKVTPTNIDKLLKSFVSKTRIDHDEKQSRDAIETIITRAAMDPRYASVYAQVCGGLVGVSNDNTSISNPTNNPLSTSMRFVSFKDILYRICREEAHQNINLRPYNGLEAINFARKRYVDSKRFIGELYNHNVLSANEIIQFLSSLLEQTNMGPGNVDELTLEGLCVLLDSCGKRLDESAEILSGSQTEDLGRCWDILVAMLGGRTKQNTPILSFRTRCLILDLVELRQLNWHPVRYGARQRKELVPRELLVDADSTLNTKVRAGQKKARKNATKKQVQFTTTHNREKEENDMDQECVESMLQLRADAIQSVDDFYRRRIKELEDEVKRLKVALTEARRLTKNQDLEDENRRLRQALATATQSSQNLPEEKHEN